MQIRVYSSNIGSSNICKYCLPHYKALMLEYSPYLYYQFDLDFPALLLVLHPAKKKLVSTGIVDILEKVSATPGKT